MCYTIEKNLTREELEKRFGKNFKPNRPYTPGKRVSGFELPYVPVIKSEHPENIDVIQWGLIPFWIRNIEDAAQIRTKTLNAKAETIIEKPSFRHTIRNKRCLVLTNGFYEWQHLNKKKIPYFIKLTDDIAMPLAGIYDSWTNELTGEIIESFSIITTKANKLMEKIHNTKKRMPVILTGNEESYWIDNSISEKNAIDLLKPYNENLMKAVPVNDEKNKIEPIQKELF